MSEEIRRETERDFDDMASAHARKSGYPWKRSGCGIGGSGTTWSLTTSDARPAPDRETRCSVAVDTKTRTVLLATYAPVPVPEGLFDFVCVCPASLASYESADAAMTAAEQAYERGLDTARP